MGRDEALDEGFECFRCIDLETVYFQIDTLGHHYVQFKYHFTITLFHQ